MDPVVGIMRYTMHKTNLFFHVLYRHGVFLPYEAALRAQQACFDICVARQLDCVSLARTLGRLRTARGQSAPTRSKALQVEAKTSYDDGGGASAYPTGGARLCHEPALHVLLV